MNDEIFRPLEQVLARVEFMPDTWTATNALRKAIIETLIRAERIKRPEGFEYP